MNHRSRLSIYFLWWFSISQEAVRIAVGTPLIIASPYPFNTSKPARVECYTNDQNTIESMSIIGSMRAIDDGSPLRHSENNLKKNGSLILNIPTSFNYSRLQSTIECHSKYSNGTETMTQLEVLAVVEIPQKAFFSVIVHIGQTATIHCYTYGTNVSLTWDFSRESSKDTFGPLPVNTYIQRILSENDTLIINHVSYSDHRGYYRCRGTNELLNVTYKDKSTTFLRVRKNGTWIPVLIALVVICACVLVLILWSEYCQRSEKVLVTSVRSSTENPETIARIKQIVSIQKSSMSDEARYDQTNFERLMDDSEESPSKESMRQRQRASSSFSSTYFRVPIERDFSPVPITSPRFILGNPLLNPAAQPLIPPKQHTTKE